MHITSRMDANFPAKNIRVTGPSHFSAKSEVGSDEYQVWLGSENISHLAHTLITGSPGCPANIHVQ